MELIKERLGDLITQRREKNSGEDLVICGVTREGFIPPKVEDADTSIYNMFYLNDFVFNPARMELNAIVFNNVHNKAICSSLYEMFYVSRTDKIVPEYLALIVKTDWFTRYCDFLGNGSAREYCRVANISEMELNIPPIDDQRRIVKEHNAYVSLVNDLQAINSKLIDLGIVDIEKCIGMETTVNKSDDEIEELNIPENCEVISIDRYCKKIGSGGTPNRNNPEYYEDGSINWLKSGEVHNNVIVESEEHITDEALKNSSAKVFPSGTVLMAMYGSTAGQVGILNIDTSTNQAICGMQCDTEEKAAFLFFALIKNQIDFKRMSNGGAQDNLSQDIIKNTKIIVPKEEAWNHIHSKVIMDEIINNSLLIQNVERLKKLLLSQLL